MLVVGPLYLTDRTAALSYFGLFAVWMAFEAVFYVRTVFMKATQFRDQNSFVIAFVSILVGVVLSISLAVSFPSASIEQGRAIVFYTGLAIMALGIALRAYAMLVLGRFFTVVITISRDQHVVQIGPYRWIRHPAYLGGLLAITGSLILSSNWLAPLGVVPIVVGVLYRIRVEERALCEAFGQEYRSYIHHTKRMLPFVY